MTGADLPGGLNIAGADLPGGLNIAGADLPGGLNVTGADLSGGPNPAGIDLVRLQGAVDALTQLAGSRGVPEAIQTTADAYPGTTSGHVVYDLGVAFSVALGDLASALEALREPVDPAESAEGRPRC